MDRFFVHRLRRLEGFFRDKMGQIEGSQTFRLVFLQVRRRLACISGSQVSRLFFPSPFSILLKV
ncbi:MAG: hypothetical protein LBP59_07465 [Planctomycetaceae bacterium]|nr:hypothetical protein [Planctomycetaceae bacterium]